MPDPKLIAAYIPFVLPVIGIVTAIPLALRRIPPNYWYGFRTRKTLSDPNLWYRANYLGGMDLLFANLLALILNLMMTATLPAQLSVPIGTGVVVVTSLVALVLWSVQVRKL